MTMIDDHDFVVLGDDDLSDYNAAGILPELPQTIRKIQQWLQPTDFSADSSEYKKHLNSYVVGTGNWIQQTQTYQTWHDSLKSSSLWIKAIPGAGKSVFAAMIADKLAQTEKVPVLYFFFRQIIAKNHDPQYLVRDWLSQILPYSPFLQSKLKRQMKDCQSLDDISTDEFWHSLIDGMASIPKVYCVADALDEMDISKLSFLDRLVELEKQQHSTIKILMTSRPLPRIESKLRTPSILEISILQIRLQQNMVDTDIAIYVDHRLRQHNDIRLMDYVREKIRNAICTKGQGSFLYARLMMDKLLDDTMQISSSTADLEQITKKLPVSLEDMYNGMLLDHATRSGVPQGLQLAILQWVTHSVRPLRLLELAAMIDSLDDNDRISKDTKALVRAACGPLLEILEDETVSIIHHSFTEFLIDQAREETVSTKMGNDRFPVIKSADTHRLLAHTCLKYLTSGRLDEWKLETRMKCNVRFIGDRSALSKHGSIKMRHPFLDYAASNICAHVAKLESSDKALFPALDDFMKPDNHKFVSWIDLTWTSDDIEGVSPLHVAAYWGMVNYCEHLIELGQDINGLDAKLRTPISWASAMGHPDIVEILLQNGASANPDDSVGLKPLHYAAMANHSAVVRLLLAAGVDPLTPRTKDYPGRFCGNMPSDIGHTPLMHACVGGGVESVLEFMTYLSAKDLNRALGWAAKADKVNVVIALLESPKISIDSTENDGGSTPLFYAAKAQNPVMIRALLEKGADPNARSKVLNEEWPVEVVRSEGNRRATPLHALAGLMNRSGPCGNSALDREDVLSECCKLLIDAGIDVHAADDNGGCPIHYSISPAITCILLKHGAKATADSKDGSTPLHFVCNNKAGGKVVELLVRHNADINAKRHVDGKTPLHLLVTLFDVQNLKNFLVYKPDVNAGDDVGNTPLHLALERSPGTDFIQALLDAGADPNKKNLNMETPIHTIKMFSSHLDIVPVLMNAGADLEARDNLGRTALLRTVNEVISAFRFQDAVKTLGKLVELGAKVDARDIYGNSALHLICQKPYYKNSPHLLQLLIEAGTDPKWINYNGNTLLHEASRVTETSGEKDRSARVQFLEMLCDLGIPPRQKNYSGATALHIACSTSRGSWYHCVWKVTIDLLVGPKFGIGIDEGDNNGICAIHLAATLPEQLVGWLVEAGADPTVRTVEGQTPLQIACRARQTNTVGQLLELYLGRSSSHMIDWKDKRGRTALHDACRSGRPETVKLLLDAGADPNMKDNNGLTPLHVCSEFTDSENFLWSSRRFPRDANGQSSTWNAANVLLGDTQRPIGPTMHYSPAEIHSEHDTARIRDSIRLLLARGADVAALSQSGNHISAWRTNFTPLCMALSLGCEVMVDELLPATQKAFDEGRIRQRNGIIADIGDPFAQQYLRLRSKHSPAILSDLVKKDDESFGWNKLLRLDNEVLFDELLNLQVDFFNQKSKRISFPETLVRWGYATLLEKFGSQVSMYHERMSKNAGYEPEFEPLLHKACRRELPNMDVVMILIDKLGVNVNARAIPSRESLPDGPGETALHILAAGQHWWQKGALEFLLQRGADIEMKDGRGQSPLSVCVSETFGTSFWRYAIADVLLRHGANPNSLDNDGVTCINKAGSSPEMIRKLIKHGADISLGATPALFTAIASHDLATVAAILESGAGCNVRQKSDKDGMPRWKRNLDERIPVTEITPLHYAASSGYNNQDHRDNALPVVRLLLAKGADLYEIFDGDKTVVHDLLEFGGILQPFFELPALDLEHRDSRGRTLLLSGCRSSFPANSALNIDNELKEEQPTVASILYAMGADIMARDSRGLNALHLLLQTIPFSNEAYKKTFSTFVKDAPLLVHQKDLDGNTPLHYALRMPRIWSIETLLSAGADPLEPDSSGNTALHDLAKVVSANPPGLEQTQLFKKFLTLGVPINARNDAGETPLFLYVAVGARLGGGFRNWLRSGTPRDDLAIFEEAGADFLARNNDMESLLHIAAKIECDNLPMMKNPKEKELIDCFRFLMERGCDPLAEDLSERTALDVAAACGNDAILKLFRREGESKPTPDGDEELEDDEDLF